MEPGDKAGQESGRRQGPLLPRLETAGAWSGKGAGGLLPAGFGLPSVSQKGTGQMTPPDDLGREVSRILFRAVSSRLPLWATFLIAGQGAAIGWMAARLGT